ncbi:hypothetical protein BDN72DRAFT_309435 [Pluteus cervinus]|uniref:Uncharacterized protein n=1 Tax=Pluteus cervinus TaxID=181527 RepID=A0ACD3ACY0_9AGAR|nr:hypothetical protein BDN72DRAFT_309435 [Pluteus cervinus]
MSAPGLPDEPVHLPHLAVLSATESPSEVFSEFLGCFDIPQAFINIICPERYEMGFGFDDLLLKLGNYLSDIDFTLRHIEYYRHRPEVTLKIASGPLQHRHSIQFRWFEESFLLNLEYICDNVDALSIENIESLSTDHLLFPTKFSTLTQLRTVTLHEHTTVFETFIPDIRFRYSRDSNIGPFLSLRKLIISKIHFETKHLEQLHSILVTRRDEGAGLEVLEFINCPGVNKDQFTDVVDHRSCSMTVLYHSA